MRRHCLGPCLQDLLGPASGVEVGHRAAYLWAVLGVQAGLVGPKVEERHVAVILGPAAALEELRELVELEVDEGGLHRDDLKAEGLRTLGRLWPEGVARQLHGLAAHADALARAHQAYRVRLVLRRVERDPDELVDASLRRRQLIGFVLVSRVPLVRNVRACLDPGPPQCVIRHGIQQAHVHATDVARVAAKPVGTGALARAMTLDALVLGLVRAAPLRPPPTRWQATGCGAPLLHDLLFEIDASDRFHAPPSSVHAHELKSHCSHNWRILREALARPRPPIVGQIFEASIRLVERPGCVNALREVSKRRLWSKALLALHACRAHLGRGVIPSEAATRRCLPDVACTPFTTQALTPMRRLVSPLDAAQLAPPAAHNFRRLVYLRIVEQREVCDLDAGRSLLLRSVRDGARDRGDR
eukprot:scaffold34748_cov68-Phaeocystis_antarctica.AAC.1